jgi:hypothetical protein
MKIRRYQTNPIEIVTKQSLRRRNYFSGIHTVRCGGNVDSNAIYHSRCTFEIVEKQIGGDFRLPIPLE